MMNKTAIARFLRENLRNQKFLLIMTLLLSFWLLNLTADLQVRRNIASLEAQKPSYLPTNQTKSNEKKPLLEKENEVKKKVDVWVPETIEAYHSKNYMSSSTKFYFSYTDDRSIFVSNSNGEFQEFAIPTDIINLKYKPPTITILDEYNEQLLIAIEYSEARIDSDSNTAEREYVVHNDLYVFSPITNPNFHKIKGFDIHPALTEVYSSDIDITTFFYAFFYKDKENRIFISEYDGLSLYDFQGNKIKTIEKVDSSQVKPSGPYIEISEIKDGKVLYMSTVSYESGPSDSTDIKIYDMGNNKYYKIPYSEYSSNWGPGLHVFGIIDDERVLIKETTPKEDNNINSDLNNQLIIYNFKNSRVEKVINIDEQYIYPKPIKFNNSSVTLSVYRKTDEKAESPLLIEVDVNSGASDELSIDENSDDLHAQSSKVKCDLSNNHLRYFISKNDGDKDLFVVNLGETKSLHCSDGRFIFRIKN